MKNNQSSHQSETMKLDPVHHYLLTYSDGDTQNVSIRMQNQEAQRYYLRAWEYWNCTTQREAFRTCIKCELLGVTDQFNDL